MQLTRKTFIISSIVFLLIPFSIPYTPTSSASSWGYQLQDYNLDKLNKLAPLFDILVIDYSKDGSDDSQFTPQEIQTLQSKNTTVLSYLSIGEAEDYRYYFNSSWISSPPTWFDGENPDWAGNYKVKYWDPEWQAIITQYLQKILDQGFNGAYLDIIDAYEFYQNVNSNANQDMMDFVISLANYSRSQDPNFWIVPQNAEELLANSTYRNIVSGIGKEDLFVSPGEGKNSKEDVTYSEEFLDLLVKDGKPVLSVDYVKRPDLVRYVTHQAQAKGYSHYIGPLDLDRLVKQRFPLGFFFYEITIILVAVITISGVLFFRKSKI